MSNLVIIQDNQAVTTSRMVAEAFEKDHKNVLQSIQLLDCSKDFYELNFQPILLPSDLGNGRTRNDKAFQITRDGFTFLAMGYTGVRAAQFKEAYIKQFNEMEATLRSPVSVPASLSIEDLIIAQANSIKELKKEVESIRGSLIPKSEDKIPQQIEVGQTQLFKSNKLISVAEYTKTLSVPGKVLSFMGRVASQYSKEKSLSIKECKNGNYYTEEALVYAYSFILKTHRIGSVPNAPRKEVDKIIDQLKKNPLAQELKSIPVDCHKLYRKGLKQVLKNIIYCKIHKCSELRFSIESPRTSKGWVKVSRIK